MKKVERIVSILFLGVFGPRQGVHFTKPFYFIGDNLYVVAIPKINEGETAIEDFFEFSVLDEKISGKSFNKGDNIDRNTEYGKVWFAKKIVKKNQDKINFDSFKQILEKIEAVIKHYNIK